ncbi:hypothetical protein GT360_06875 [Vibrio astriarenae]|uniref:Carbohydrate kinase PfkB domain-containing protein n=1 Tax=Vibrio astriarenae TaxID=1481923 RepID=A0A7Z2T2Q5_9VIBR|nr:carbohydrate kinase family protein [Vibrio astriarenae]QIA63254.1 hypothetical protein GT360_06875 [Vibrio astriarenae]
MKTVACVGMAVADLIVGPLESFEFCDDVTLVDHVNVKPGGDAANVALNLAAMGVDVSLYSKLGDDLFGRHLLKVYRVRGIGTKTLSISKKHATAVAIGLVQHDGERVFLYQGGAVDALTMDDIKIGDVLAKDILHTSGFYLLPGLENSGLTELFYTAKRQGKMTSLDVGWDVQGRWLEKIESLLPSLTYFLPTLKEAQQIAQKISIEDCAAFFIRKGVEVVVINAGVEGAYVCEGERSYWVHGEPMRKIIDTTGAGDGFVSGFLAAIARGYSIFEAVNVANRAGAAVMQQYGSSGAITHFEQVDTAKKCHDTVI